MWSFRAAKRFFSAFSAALRAFSARFAAAFFCFAVCSGASCRVHRS